MKQKDELVSFSLSEIQKRRDFYQTTEFAQESSRDIVNIASMIAEALNKKRKLMFCGNGGSAAEAQHMAAEYAATLDHNRPRKGYSAIALTTDTSFITAWSNDFGFEEVFARQVESIGVSGDVLLCYSTSGTSKNILRAAEMALSNNIEVIGFTGATGGALKEIASACYQSPSSETPIIQEHHTMVGHLICGTVEKILESSF